MIKITLPFPPTSNSLFSGGYKSRRRYKSKKYKEWIQLCPKLEAFNIDYKIFIYYMIFFPDDRIRDGQNYMKAPLDYLVNEKVIKDDSRKFVCGEMWLDKGIDKENARIELTLKKDIFTS